MLIAGVLGGAASGLPLLRAILNALGVIEAESDLPASTRIYGMLLNIIPGAITFIVMVAKLLGTDLVEEVGMDPETYADIVQILTEKFGINLFTRFGNFFLYLLIGANSLPVNDSAEFNRSRLPGFVEGDWSWNGLPIFVTIGYWFSVASFAIKQYAKPYYLKFDELTIAISLGSEFVFWTIDFGFDYALGYVVTSLPWAAILWFVFDGDMSE